MKLAVIMSGDDIYTWSSKPRCEPCPSGTIEKTADTCTSCPGEQKAGRGSTRCFGKVNSTPDTVIISHTHILLIFSKTVLKGHSFRENAELEVLELLSHNTCT